MSDLRFLECVAAGLLFESAIGAGQPVLALSYMLCPGADQVGLDELANVNGLSGRLLPICSIGSSSQSIELESKTPSSYCSGWLGMLTLSHGVKTVWISCQLDWTEPQRCGDHNLPPLTDPYLTPSDRVCMLDAKHTIEGLGAPRLFLANQLAVPGFTAFVDGEDGDDEASHRVEPGRAGQSVQANPEQG